MSMVFSDFRIRSALIVAGLFLLSTTGSATEPAPLQQLFSFIDDTPGADAEYRNCQQFQSVATLGSKTFICDFTAQTRWPGIATDYVSPASGSGAWTQKVIVTAPTRLGLASSDYFYLGAGGDDIDLYIAIFHDMLAQLITLPPFSSSAANIDSMLNSGCSQVPSQELCITANLASLLSFAGNVPTITQLDVPPEPMEVKSPINGQYYSRSEDDLVADSMMYPATNLASIEDYMDYIVLFPMASSIVHGMEAGIASLGKIGPLSGLPQINQYVLSGASKRGWTLYLALAYDHNFKHMVKAAIPIVMPFDLPAVLAAIHRDYYFPSEYNGWSDDLQDFEQDRKYGTGDRNILDNLVNGALGALDRQMDIGPYLAGYSSFLQGFPILEVATSHDSYFTPDAPQVMMSDFWLNNYNTYATLLILPNIGHGNIPPSAYPGLVPSALQIVGFIVDVTGIEGNILGYAPQSTYANLFEAELYQQSAGGTFFIETSVKPAVVENNASEVNYRCAYAEQPTDLLDTTKTQYSEAQYFNDVEFTQPDFLTWRWFPAMNTLLQQMQGCGGNVSAPYLAFFLGVTFPEGADGKLIGTHYRNSPIYVVSNPRR